MVKIHMYVGQGSESPHWWYWMGLADNGGSVMQSGFTSREAAVEAARAEKFKGGLEKVYHLGEEGEG